ncbi:ATP-binding protein [Halorussus gelatinilyticus]|uniref:ATP-binding protein n=1 Tax=Halorussus gelatinilyticus TaxID=2937524 RepID=A0A8U0IKX7_9EURY|nr:ATP-binding protein [Halorussus gelatinilyticus]UPW00982.1 ATP-binding protein [Halorussus gelatinilyticus]
MTDLGDFSRSGGDDDSDTSESSPAATDEFDADDSDSAPVASDSDATDRDGAGDDLDDVGDFETTSSAARDDDRFDTVPTDPRGTDTGIGTLSAAEGLRIGEDEDETHVQAYVTADNREDVRVGKYLLVPYPDGEKLFARVAALEYRQEYRVDDATEIHSKRAMRRDDIEETDYKLMADLEPVAVLYEDGEGPDVELKRRMTDRVPKPKSVVREASDKPEIKTGLKMPEDGVFLGHLSVGGEKVRTAAEPPTIDYRLKDDYADGDPLVFRHTLVAGGTGSGKTHGAKNVLRQFLADERRYEMEDGAERRAAVVQFDPQDEYAQMHDDNPDVTREDERKWEAENVAHGGHDDTVAFVPKVGNSSYAADHHRAEQVEFTIPFSMVRDRPWLVAGASLNDNQYNALTLLIRRFFDQFGDAGTYREFVDYIDDPALREELDESGRVHEATYDAVKRRVIGSAFADVFDQDARPITDQIRSFVKPGQLTVVPTYHVNDSRATEVVVLALASLLVDEKLSNAPRYDRVKETPLVVGMDEAHNFLTDADSVQARKVIGKFTEAAKQGRKERLGLFLITQDPQDIHEAVFKQINTTVVLNLGDEDAIKSVNIPSKLEGKVPYMEKGQMVVYSPDNSEPVEIIGLSKCVTKHGRE